MTKRLYSSRLTVMIMMIIITIFCSQAISAEFTADLIDINSGDTTIGMIYVKGLKYRMEKEEDGQQIIIIVNQEANLTQAINVNEKAYMEMNCDDMRSLVNDPFQSLKYTLAIPDVVVKKIGTETISNVECDKSVITYSDLDYFTQWISKKYDFPVKIIAHASGEKVFLLSNIKESTVDDALFKVPDGYTKIGEEEPSTPVEPAKQGSNYPEWMKDVSSVEFAELPTEKVMLEGEMIRIKVVAGKDIFIMGTNVQSGNSTFFAVPYLNGQPIDDSSVVFSEYGDSRMHNLMMEGVAWPATLTETPEQADEVIVRVGEGKIKMAFEYSGKP